MLASRFKPAITRRAPNSSKQLQKTLTDAKADEDLIAHVAFQRMWASTSSVSTTRTPTQAKLQEKWLTDLQAFVGQYPKSADSAEALFQLGMYQEFIGKERRSREMVSAACHEFPERRPSRERPTVRFAGSVRSASRWRFAATTSKAARSILAPSTAARSCSIHYWTTSASAGRKTWSCCATSTPRRAAGDFDIIGVCLDDDPTAAKQYVAQNKLPWKQIYEKGGLDGRLANEMGVITLPLMILVDQKGNVANQNVHVAELDTELARLAKPADAAPTRCAGRRHRPRDDARTTAQPSRSPSPAAIRRPAIPTAGVRCFGTLATALRAARTASGDIACRRRAGGRIRFRARADSPTRSGTLDPGTAFDFS